MNKREGRKKLNDFFSQPTDLSKQNKNLRIKERIMNS